MGLMTLKLQNIILPNNKYLKKHWQLQYRGEKMAYNAERGCYILPQNRCADFFTYFNSISIKKWFYYTKITNISLHLIIKGYFKIDTFGYRVKNDIIEKEDFDSLSFSLDEPVEVVIKLKQGISSVVSFAITALSECEIYSGYYATEIDESKVRDVDIAIATTTFRKEKYITENVKVLKDEILAAGEDFSRHFFINIVDNGRTLAPADFNTAGIRLFPNPNVGGSGGYARGMIEALRGEKKPTHVLLMDDDVIVNSESFKRTFYLLRLLKDEFVNHFISGAMLYCEKMNIQHEDIGYVHPDGAYGPQKPSFDLENSEAVVRNEENYDKSGDRYAGWWYCCIPTTYIEEHELPLPLFIRGDDVEYSLRGKAEFITLNGICIWHMGFVSKFNAAIEMYQVHRNSLILQSFSDVCRNVDFMWRIINCFRIEIRRFNYDSCELLLNSIDDYLKGPDFLLLSDGEQLMKKHAALNEKLTPLSDYPNIEVDFAKAYKFESLNFFQKVFYKATYNGHLCPKFLLRSAPGVIAYGWFYCPKRQYRRKSVLAVNKYDKTGVMRSISTKRFFELFRHYKRTMRNYKKNHKAVEEQYRSQREKFTSYEFWKQYLGI